jgi:ubiquinone biosynthesis accessory factor UbiJ
MVATPAWLGAVETMLNRGIGASARGVGLARRLEATAVRIDLDGLTSIRAAVQAGRLALVAAERGADDGSNAVLAGTPLALFNLARAPGGGAVRGTEARVQVSGDAEIANAYRELFTLARPDLEEELSRVVGDLPARRLARVARRTGEWLRHTRHTAGQNIAEYLQEESRDLVNRPELEEFLHGVDQVREAADRVEARLARLEQRLKGA